MRSRARWLTSILAIVLVGALGLASAAPASAAPAKPEWRHGSITGPIAVSGGSTLRQVAALPLRSGNWTVFVKGSFVNTTGSNAHRTVRCRLSAGGAFDETHGAPRRADLNGSTQPFLSAMTVHLGTSRDALVRCAAPGSSRGDIVIRDLRIAAYRSVGLATGPEASEFAIYGDIGSPFTVAEVYDMPGDAFGSSYAPMTSLSLPAGAWAITAKGTVRQAGGSLGVARCELVTGVDFDLNRAWANVAGSPGDRMPISLEVVRTSGSPFGVELACRDDLGTAGLSLRHVRIVAVKTTGLLNQHLDDGTFAALPGVKPVVNAGFEDGPVSWDAGVGWDPVRSMSLPAGRWVVLGKGYLTRDDPTDDVRTIRCRLGRPGSYDGVSVRLPAAAAFNHLGPFVLLWSGAFDARREVTLACKSPAGTDASMNWLKLVAYKAGSLANRALD